MKQVKFSIFGLSLAFLLTLAACSEEKPGEVSGSFDRGAMLSDVCDNFILPGFDSLHTAQQRYQRAFEAMVANPDQYNIFSFRAKWEECLYAYQRVRMFNFGPGEKSIFGEMDENMATFPVNTDSIVARMSRGDLNMKDFRRDTRGYLALDFLLYPNSLDSFSSTSYTNYIQAVNVDLYTWTDELWNGWLAYANTFKSSTDKGAGSSISELYNHMLQSYEDLKNYQLGLPSGLMLGQTQPEPHLVQAYYSGLSIPLMKMHYTAIEDLWHGRTSSGQDFIGFKEYLASVVGGEELIASTEVQMEAVNAALKNLKNIHKLSDRIQVDFETVKQVHTELQKLTRFLKSDLSSLLGIAITYSSGDGD